MKLPHCTVNVQRWPLRTFTAAADQDGRLSGERGAAPVTFYTLLAVAVAA